MVNDPVLRTHKVHYCFFILSFKAALVALQFLDGELIIFLSLYHMLFVQPLSVELGPGILGNIFDGIQVQSYCLNSSTSVALSSLFCCENNLIIYLLCC